MAAAQWGKTGVGPAVASWGRFGGHESVDSLSTFSLERGEGEEATARRGAVKSGEGRCLSFSREGGRRGGMLHPSKPSLCPSLEKFLSVALGSWQDVVSYLKRASEEEEGRGGGGEEE